MFHIDITIDIETCALTSHASILQVACVAWDRFAKDEKTLFGDTCHDLSETKHFQRNCNLNEQFVRGCFDFSQDTTLWWGKQHKEAQKSVSGLIQDLKPEPLAEVLLDLHDWIKRLMEDNNTKTLTCWSQGTDFDIPILRHAAGVYHLEHTLPSSLHHSQLRDCRTAIYELTALHLQSAMAKDEDNEVILDMLGDPLMAYRMLPGLPESFDTEDTLKHTALHDAVRSSWYTWQALKAIRQH